MVSAVLAFSMSRLGLEGEDLGNVVLGDGSLDAGGVGGQVGLHLCPGLVINPSAASRIGIFRRHVQLRAGDLQRQRRILSALGRSGCLASFSRYSMARSGRLRSRRAWTNSMCGSSWARAGAARNRETPSASTVSIRFMMSSHSGKACAQEMNRGEPRIRPRNQGKHTKAARPAGSN